MCGKATRGILADRLDLSKDIRSGWRQLYSPIDRYHILIVIFSAIAHGHEARISPWKVRAPTWLP